jgi:hypothetical protein
MTGSQERYLLLAVANHSLGMTQSRPCLSEVTHCLRPSEGFIFGNTLPPPRCDAHHKISPKVGRPSSPKSRIPTGQLYLLIQDGLY